MTEKRKRVSQEVLQYDEAWVAQCAADTAAAFGFDEIPMQRQRAALLRAARAVWQRELTPCQRQYFALYCFEGKTMKEIAEQYSVAESTVSRTLKRARIRLRRYLQYYLTDAASRLEDL